MEPVIGKYWDITDLKNRMRRIEGQARGIQAMLDREEECKSILTQLSAMSGALDKVYRVVAACGLADTLRRDATGMSNEAIREVLESLHGSGRL